MGNTGKIPNLVTVSFTIFSEHHRLFVMLQATSLSENLSGCPSILQCISKIIWKILEFLKNLFLYCQEYF